MTLSSVSAEVVSRVAHAVTGAASVDAAVIALTARLSDALDTRAIPFVREASSWRAVGDELSSAEARAWLPVVADSASGRDACALVRGDDAPFPTATLIRVGIALAPDAAVVVEGDWSDLHETLCGVASVARLALDAVREREQSDRVERQLIGGYAMARRLSRLGSVESVAQQIVDSVAQVIEADRVSLAVYKSSEDALSIVATHGFPRAAVADVRVRPGEWVLGHVYASKRSLFVSDVRLIPGMARRGREYRTFGFAAVPLVAGCDIIGVLTVTDKRDGQSFNHHDAILLRGLSVVAAVSLAAARGGHEAAQLAYAATIDALTGLMNRPSLDKRLHQEVERSRREKTSLAVMMADVDDFKRINDSRGHHVGDAVLRTIAGVVRSAVRVFDVCARYGGDEFAIVMPNCDRTSAVACAERIRARLREAQQRNENAEWPGELTLSIGVAVMNDDESPQELLQRADHCLYKVKAGGKDAVRSDESREPVFAGPRPVPPRPQETPADTATEMPARDTTPLPYVLVVDTDEERVNLCLQAVQPFKCGLLVARTGSLAASLVNRFGPPMLLIVDLSLASGDAFAAIDALRQDTEASTDVVAWSASKEAREFAASKVRSARVVSVTAGHETLLAAIQTALHRRHNRERVPSDEDYAADRREVQAADLVDRVRRICALPGVAIYLKDPDEDGFRVTVSWLLENVPQPALDLPVVFDCVRESGRTVFHPETRGPSVLPSMPIRTAIGVPIELDRQIVGVICAYDVNPLRLDALSVAALEGLGATVMRPSSRGQIAARREAGAVREHRFDDRRAAAPVVDLRERPAVSSAWQPALLERSGGEFAVARELSRAKREGRQLSIVLFSFAAGRAAGDPTEHELDDIADTLLKAVRQSDLPIRWSVTELLVVLPGLGTKEAKAVAERVRAALSAGTRNRVPVSGGVEEIAQEESFLTVVDRARQKVAAAMDRGHNRVV